MTDDEKANAVRDAVRAAAKLKPTFTGTSEQRKRLWRLAVWRELETAMRESFAEEAK